MIQFNRSQIEAAAALVGEKTHLDALRTHLPQFFEPHVENGLSKRGSLPFRAAVFNMEQGTRLQYIIPFLQCHPQLKDVDIILANELDSGMARSGNRNTTREVAEALGMNYVFGIEFITRKAGQDGNTQGLHGNAIFSRFPLYRCKVVPLPIQFDWFYMPGDSVWGTQCHLAEARSLPANESVWSVSIWKTGLHLRSVCGK